MKHIKLFEQFVEHLNEKKLTKKQQGYSESLVVIETQNELVNFINNKFKNLSDLPESNIQYPGPGDVKEAEEAALVDLEKYIKNSIKDASIYRTNNANTLKIEIPEIKNIDKYATSGVLVAFWFNWPWSGDDARVSITINSGVYTPDGESNYAYNENTAKGTCHYLRFPIKFTKDNETEICKTNAIDIIQSFKNPEFIKLIKNHIDSNSAFYKELSSTQYDYEKYGSSKKLDAELMAFAEKMSKEIINAYRNNKNFNEDDYTPEEMHKYILSSVKGEPKMNLSREFNWKTMTDELGLPRK